MPSENGALDVTNLRLLSELQQDARISQAELGRRVGLSAPAVALGFTLAAIIRMRPAPRQIPKVAEVARATPEVAECHRVTGEDCFYMRVHVRDVEHLEEVIDCFTPYGQTTTSIIQSSPVAQRELKPA